MNLVSGEHLLDDLRRRAAEAIVHWQSEARIVDVWPLAGGSSSLTYTAAVQGGSVDRIVLKVAPPGLAPVRNRDVLRQGRVIGALHGKPGVAVPDLCFADGGHPPDSPPFIAMSFVAGECSEPVLADEREPARFGEIRARALDAAAVLAAIHRVDPVAAGLGDEPVVSLADEIDRWTRAFNTVPPDLQGDYVRCAAALHATMPPAATPVINHGDFRVGNMLCDGERVAAVIDWEIWSLGDPRIDLTWMTYFTDEARHPAALTAAASGMPSPAELLDAYVAAGGQTFPDREWFDALTRYKEAAASALLIKRGRKAGMLPPSIARMVDALPDLLAEAHELIGA